MTGARLEINVDIKQVSSALERALQALGGAGFTDLLNDIGIGLVQSTQERQRRGVDPDGRPWVKLSAGYAGWKAQERPGAGMLQFNDHMLGPQLSSQVEGTAVLVGTSAPYGAFIQLGTKPHTIRAKNKKALAWGWGPGPRLEVHHPGMPARPFLGVSNEDSREIVDIGQDHLQAALRG